jgi:hypothetical protein
MTVSDAFKLLCRTDYAAFCDEKMQWFGVKVRIAAALSMTFLSFTTAQLL